MSQKMSPNQSVHSVQDSLHEGIPEAKFVGERSCQLQKLAKFNNIILPNHECRGPFRTTARPEPFNSGAPRSWFCRQRRSAIAKFFR
jgi:hypothetical protein